VSSTLLEQYSHAADEFGSRVALIDDDHWHASTPCSDWDVHALLAHMVDELRWVPYLVSGGRFDDAGDRFDSDPLGDDPRAAWSAAREQAWSALNVDGALDQHVWLSYGEVSARDYLWELTVDLTIHAWDLARGIGADDRLDAELVRRIYHETEKDVERLAASGRFRPPVNVASSADLQARTLALFGRRT
jgi:uncharacterized protein (TIGR03086 family)